MQQTTFATETLSLEAGADSLPFPSAQVARLSSAFLELDEEHRIVLSLHFFERLSLEEVAQVLDDSEESVREVYVEAVARLVGRVGRERDAA